MKINFSRSAFLSFRVLTIFSFAWLIVCFLNSPNFAQEKPSIRNKVPDSVPIKVEILTPEKAEDYPEKIRVKVTNTGEKPIYAIRLYLDLVDVREKRENAAPNGEPFFYGFQLYYGRPELQGIATDVPNENDKPIRPNEFHVFTVNKSRANLIMNKIANRGDQRPQIYNLVFFSLNYGDGTGYSGAFPYSKSKQN